MADVYIVPDFGVGEFHDIHTVIQVSLVTPGGDYPTGLQAWLKPVISTPADLNVSMGDFTKVETYATWQFSRADWDAYASTPNVDGYKLITFTVDNPTYGGPSPNDKIGFNLVSANQEEWNLQAAAFTSTRVISASVIPAPEPSSVILSAISGAAILFAAWRRYATIKI